MLLVCKLSNLQATSQEHKNRSLKGKLNNARNLVEKY